MQGQQKSSAVPRKAIGYTRVSTEMQAGDGVSLERQVQRLRDWCEVNGYQMTFIYEDVASAVGRNNLRHRPEFEQAVREALQAGVPLIVSDVARASRDLQTLDKLVIQRGLTVISVADGGEVPVAVLRMRVGEGAERARRTAEGTRQALSRVVRPKPFGAETWHHRAAQRSAAKRVDKKHQVLERVVDYLARHPELMDATSRAVADALNAEGIRTGWDKTWTASSVRGKWTVIQEELSFRREQEEEDTRELHDGPVLGRARPEPPAQQSDPVPQEADLVGPGDAGLRDQDDEDSEGEARMREHPLFGMF